MPRLDDLIEPRKGPPTNEENIGRIYLEELLLGVLSPPLRRHTRRGPLYDLEESLLYTFTTHIPSDRGVVTLPADLVDFIDIDDAPLGTLYIMVRRLQ